MKKFKSSFNDLQQKSFWNYLIFTYIKYMNRILWKFRLILAFQATCFMKTIPYKIKRKGVFRRFHKIKTRNILGKGIGFGRNGNSRFARSSGHFAPCAWTPIPILTENRWKVSYRNRSASARGGFSVVRFSTLRYALRLLYSRKS